MQTQDILVSLVHKQDKLICASVIATMVAEHTLPHLGLLSTAVHQTLMMVESYKFVLLMELLSHITGLI